MILPFETPSPDTTPVELWEASPGILGFILGFFVLGIALIPLMWSMTRHLRKIRHMEDPADGADDTNTSNDESQTR